MRSARSLIARRPRSAARWPIMLAAVVLSVAGCVSMPNGGPPLPLEATQSGTGQNQDYTVLYANPPEAGYTPEQIVQGFLLASLRYSNPAQQQVARDYLTPTENDSWHPEGAVTVFTQVPKLDQYVPKDATQATVTVTGQVAATLNGNGQQVLSVAAGAQPSQSDACGGSASSAGSTCEPFTLTKYQGQWRIAHLPSNLLIDESDFVQVYQTQDVYFLGVSAVPTIERLVPDTVFVPLGTSVTSLLTTLVKTLITGPGPTWLGDNNATRSALPPNTTARVSVSSGSTTAAVYLSGTIPSASLPDIAAQLVWTLAAQSGAQFSITAVELYVNGTPWEPNGSIALTPAAYSGYNPYDLKVPTSFTYVDDSGAAQSLCGSVNGLGQAVPVFGVADEPRVTSCGAASPLPTASPSTPATAKPGHAVTQQTANPLSMVAVSPSQSGVTYVAGVSPNKDLVSIWQVGGRGSPVYKWNGPGITSISWDRQHDLWVTTSSGVSVLEPSAGRSYPVEQDQLGGTATALSVAPDGVRVAAIVNGELELAAISQGTATAGKVYTPAFLIGSPILLGPSVTDAVAVTWYDIDDLRVIAAAGASRVAEEVPVNGQAASPLASFPAQPAGVYAESIAGNGAANVLVVGFSNGQLAYYDSFNDTWQPLARGAAPAYDPNP
jgi:Lipoprotein LpqB beta-propeller domain/Sporulation and spore germination